MRKSVLAVGLLAALVAAPGVAQTCTTEATIGSFDVEFEGAVFDGINTEFTYCVTNSGGGQALSHWALELDLRCVKPEELVTCGPIPCFYQKNDPTTGITGIKWDDTQVAPGETECFDFTLEGDWTAALGNVVAGMKAGQSVATGEICGPLCEPCEAAIRILSEGKTVLLDIEVTHNRPPTEIRTIEYAIVDRSRTVLHSWDDGPITFSYRSTHEYFGPIPNMPKLPSGEYILLMRLDGMSGWHWRTTPFFVK